MFHKQDSKPPLVQGQRFGAANCPRQKGDRLKSIVATGLAIALLGALGASALASPKEAAPIAGTKEVTYPANQFDNGKARHFQHKTSDGTTIRYFIMKSSDGVIRAAFDACDVCWREGKGYVQKDDVMVCRNCGRSFPSRKINEVTGGCNPSALARKVEGGKVILRVEAILEGRKYFDLKRGKT